MRSGTYVCVPCRVTAKATHRPLCSRCAEPMTYCGTTWRAPKKTDNASWRLIESGTWLTEKVRGRYSTRLELPYSIAARPTPYQRRNQGSTGSTETARVRALLDSDPKSPKVADAAKHPNTEVRALVASTSDISAEVAAVLARDKDTGVAAAAVRRANALPTDKTLRNQLARGPEQVRRALASRADLTPAQARRLLRDRSTVVVQAAAANAAAPVDALLRIPLAWVPATRLTDLASGDRLRLLVELRANAADDLTCAAALRVADLVIAPT